MYNLYADLRNAAQFYVRDCPYVRCNSLNQHIEVYKPKTLSIPN